jgi:Putative peptidoglycan binding domain
VSLLALLLGWVLARTIRIVPASHDRPPPPPPGSGRTPRRGPSTARRPTGPTVPASMPATSSPPWPQVVPSGLPPFPAGWVPYEPPPGAVVQRASSLLASLWKGGEGTFKVEKTAGVWVYYRATAMGSKRGVVAYRERVPSLAPVPSAGPITVTPLGPAPGGPTAPASNQSVALPTLRRGASGSDVRILQQRLGLAVDGKFGPGTEAAVRAHQARSGLAADGVVGPRTWASLMARAA